ncbi:MAG TPA: carboxypeptidase regulatory-like domain-containing protein [Gemmatimonadaceae bacterium]
MIVRLPFAAAALAALVASAPLAAQIGAPRQPALQPDTTERATVMGIVYDSIGMRRLPGATIQMVPAADPQSTGYGTVSDRNGRFRIDSVPQGQYLVGFHHPDIEAMGLMLPTRATTVAGARTTLVLSTPSPSALALALCPAPAPGDSSATLTGFVRNADTGEPLAGSSVVMLWTEVTLDEHGLRQQRRQFPIPVGDDGRYTACGVPAGIPLTLRAERGTDVSGFVEAEVPPRGLAWRDFGIGIQDSLVTVAVDSTGGAEAAVKVRRGEAQLSGIVRNADGRPVQGATVLVWGSGVEGTTDAAGRFLLTGLPSGTHNLEVRRIGFQPERVPVTLGRRRPAAVTVALREAVPVLEPVEVVGQREEDDRTGFLQRSKRGFGDYITSDEIEKRHAIATSDLLRTTPGIQVVPGGPMGSTILMRGSCRPALWIDGMRLTTYDSIDNLVQPGDIVGIEIYKSPAETPPQFSGGTSGGCGTIVVWTGARKRAGR